MYPSNWTLMKHTTSINPHVPSSMFLVLKPCLFDCSDIFRSSIWFTCGKITHVGIGRVAAGFQQSFSIPTLGVAHSSNRMDWTLDARQPMKAACVLDTLIVMEIPQGLAPVLWHIDNFTSRHFPSTESCSVARIELQQPSAPDSLFFYQQSIQARVRGEVCDVRRMKSATGEELVQPPRWEIKGCFWQRDAYPQVSLQVGKSFSDQEGDLESKLQRDLLEVLT